jgi:hypothetical protein
MAKRLTDTGIWNKDWFLDLTDKQKLLVKFLFDNCDCAGIYEISYRNLKNCFNEEITKEDFLKIKQIKFLSETKIFIEDFIFFQYGITIENLNEKNRVHKGIIKSLEKNGVLKPLPKGLETLNKPLPNCTGVGVGVGVGINNPLNKDYKEKENLIKEKESFFNPDSFCSTKTDELFSIYKANCKNLIPIRYEKRNRRIQEKIQIFLEETNADMVLFKELCEKANKLEKIANRKIDFEMMLNCYVGILNGKYESNAPPERPVLTRESILKMIRDE